MPIHSSRQGFTLIELLVVIAIIAILAVVVVLTLNPAQMLAQSRDATRLSDMATIQSAINLYNTDQSGSVGYSLGNASSVYISVPSASSSCSTLGLASPPGTYSYACSSSTRLVNNQGWIPINFSNISAGTPLGTLPIDPVDQTSSDLYYTYNTNGNQYVISSFIESQKYAKTAFNEGGSDPVLLQSGSGADSLPDLGRGLVGYWPLNEGSNGTAVDWSGGGNNGTWSGPPNGINGYYSAGKTSNWAGYFNGASSSLDLVQTLANIPIPSPSAWTCTAWINPAATTSIESPFIVIPSSGIGQFCRAYLNNVVGGISASFKDSSGNPYVVNSTGYSFPANTWIFFATTWDGTTETLYINGTLNNSATPGASPPSVGTARLVIGDGGSYYYNGLVDDARIYDRVLSATEIQEIYNAEK